MCTCSRGCAGLPHAWSSPLFKGITVYARGDFRYKRSKLALPTITLYLSTPNNESKCYFADAGWTVSESCCSFLFYCFKTRRRSADPGSWEVVRPPSSLSKHAVPLLLFSDPDSSNRNIHIGLIFRPSTGCSWATI